MVLNEEKIARVAHRVLDALLADPEIEKKRPREVLLARIKGILLAEAQQDAQCDAVVLKKLASYARPIPEGSVEWNILYQKLFDEEMKKRRR
jgi:hypothetical protein